jgi:hypothetical protein
MRVVALDRRILARERTDTKNNHHGQPGCHPRFWVAYHHMQMASMGGRAAGAQLC